VAEDRGQIADNKEQRQGRQERQERQERQKTKERQERQARESHERQRQGTFDFPRLDDLLCREELFLDQQEVLDPI
jgi:hypothetical protein